MFCMSSIKEMEERKQPKLMLRDFLGLFSFFKFLVAVSAVAGIFGWIFVAHLAVRRLSLTLF